MSACRISCSCAAGEHRDRGAAADGTPGRVVGAFAGEIDETEENLAHDLLFRGRGFRVAAVAERSVDFIRAFLQRAAHAAQLTISLRVEMAIGEAVFPRFLLPEQIERVLQQRQRTRLALHVLDDLLDQPLLEDDAVPRGRLLDRLAQLVGVHVRDEVDVLLDDLGELREGAEAIEKIGAHGQDELGRAVRRPARSRAAPR